MKKRIIAAILTLAIIASIGTVASAAATFPSDITGHEYETQIRRIDNYGGLAGLVSGGKFNPDVAMTQAEFCLMVSSVYPGRNLGISGGSTYVTMDWACNALVTASTAMGYKTSWSSVTSESLTRARACMLVCLWIDSDNGLKNAAGTTGTTSNPSATTTTNPTNVFTDVATGAYYYEPIMWAYRQGITAGTGTNTFSPEAICSKAQVIVFIWRAAGRPSSRYACPISGIETSSVYYTPLCWAAEKGMISGSDDTSDPTQTVCTRAAMVFYLWKAAGSPNVASKYYTKFTDVPANASYVMATGWASKQGITVGTSATTYSPYTAVTRGQAVTFLYRAYA